MVFFSSIPCPTRAEMVMEMMKVAAVLIALSFVLLGGGLGFYFWPKEEQEPRSRFPSDEIIATLGAQKPVPFNIRLQVELPLGASMIIQLPANGTNLEQPLGTTFVYEFPPSPKPQTLIGQWRDKKGQWHPLYEDMKEKKREINYNIPTNTPFTLKQGFRDLAWGDVDLLRYTLKTPGGDDHVWYVTPTPKG